MRVGVKPVGVCVLDVMERGGSTGVGTAGGRKMGGKINWGESVGRSIVSRIGIAATVGARVSVGCMVGDAVSWMLMTGFLVDMTGNDEGAKIVGDRVATTGDAIGERVRRGFVGAGATGVEIGERVGRGLVGVGRGLVGVGTTGVETGEEMVGTSVLLGIFVALETEGAGDKLTTGGESFPWLLSRGGGLLLLPSRR